jgi:adenosylcobinamide kinase/adenosylcobinamide-phosphate guanylyltransferase
VTKPGLTFVVGGARSGKSSHALRLAEATGRPVAFIATGEARDDEMRERIAAHQRERPAAWRTVEEPLDLAGALRGLAGEEFAIVDCLSLWVSNLLESRDAVAVEGLAAEAAALAAAHAGGCAAVSNEVGMGIVPRDALARTYRDVLGRVNAIWAEAADDAVLAVAGRVLRLERA